MRRPVVDPWIYGSGLDLYLLGYGFCRVRVRVEQFRPGPVPVPSPNRKILSRIKVWLWKPQCLLHIWVPAVDYWSIHQGHRESLASLSRSVIQALQKWTHIQILYFILSASFNNQLASRSTNFALSGLWFAVECSNKSHLCWLYPVPYDSMPEICTSQKRTCSQHPQAAKTYLRAILVGIKPHPDTHEKGSHSYLGLFLKLKWRQHCDSPLHQSELGKQCCALMRHRGELPQQCGELTRHCGELLWQCGDVTRRCGDVRGQVSHRRWYIVGILSYSKLFKGELNIIML
jgi:hypothetical protein